MLLIKLNGQGGIERYPYTLRMLEKDNPRVSIGENPTDEELADLGAARVQTVPRPYGDVVTEVQPELVDGIWRQTWDVRDFTQEEIEQRRKALVPQAVPALEALLALDAAGLSADYEAWAKDPARTFAERAFIDKAQNWRRDDPTLQAAAEALELSSEQVDQLFIAADQALAAV